MNVYFVGAGGIGMAALERYFLSRGAGVAGYDRTATPLTRALETEGVNITYDDDETTIPAEMLDDPNLMVVYTPAIPSDNKILNTLKAAGHTPIKRSAVLGHITRSGKSLCFAGTHGKTTTSSMAAHILNTATVGCNAFLGGILRNTGSNIVLSKTSPWYVAEADEYDRSFHKLTPYIAVITATDPDHLDIYGTEEAYLESFARFTELIVPDGKLIIHTGLKLTPRPASTVKTYTYSRDEGDFHAENIRRGRGTIIFDCVTPDHTIKDIELGVPVEINITNAIAAIAATTLTGDVTDKDVRQAMADFGGAERRFQFHLKEAMPGGHVIIDDYAHHPDELKQSIASVKALYPESHLTVAFQPHLYTRTRDFAPEFAKALSMADRVVLCDIYPARELPIPGVTSEIILNKITTKDKLLVKKENLPDTIKNLNFEILLIAGAGDIVNYIDEIVANTVTK